MRQKYLVKRVSVIAVLLGVAILVFALKDQMHWVETAHIAPDPVMVKKVILVGKTTYIQPTRISELVDAHGKDGMLALDPERLRIAVEEESWVYRARVRKVWPDQVEVWVEEQRAAARWGDDGYLNLSGEFFESAGVGLGQAELPRIDSMLEDTEAIYRQLTRFSSILGQHSPQEKGKIIEMKVDQRGAITLLFAGELELKLGRRWMEQRLTRWAAQSPVIMAKFSRGVRKVDLRYERGMVLELNQQGQSNG